MAVMGQIRGGAGGGEKVKVGTFSVSVNQTKEVNEIGFEPKKLVVYKVSAGSGSYLANYSTEIVFDKDISTTKQYRTYVNTSTGGGGGDVLNIDGTSYNRITEINSSGFKYAVGSESGWAGTYSYIAWSD